MIDSGRDGSGRSPAVEPVRLTRRRWLIRGGVILVVAGMALAGVGQLLQPPLSHWSYQVGFGALVAAAWWGGEWLIGRGYRHRSGGQTGDQQPETS